MKTRVILFCIAILAAPCLSQSGAAGKPSLTPVLGVWRCQMEGLPAITLTVTDEGGSLTGAVLFYLHRREPGQTVTASPGVPEPLFNPHFDGKTLTFQVSHRRAHPPGSLNDGPVTFQLRLEGDSRAQFVNKDEYGPNAPVFTLQKTEY